MLDVLKVIFARNRGRNHGVASGQQYRTSDSGGNVLKPGLSDAFYGDVQRSHPAWCYYGGRCSVFS